MRRNILSPPPIPFLLFRLDACLDVDVDYMGNDIGGKCVPNINRWQLCDAYCRTLSSCLYWSWVSEDHADVSKRKICCLKSRKALTVGTNGVISGSRNCNKRGRNYDLFHIINSKKTTVENFRLKVWKVWLFDKTEFCETLYYFFTSLRL